VPNLEMQITAAGRKRVQSDDFAKTLVHVIDAAGGYPMDYGFQLVATYVAMNLLVEEGNFVEMPAPAGSEAEAAALCAFMNANDKEIRAALQHAMSSPAYLAHAIACHGTDGLDEYLAQFPQA
jgi:hypothetical protein